MDRDVDRPGVERRIEFAGPQRLTAHVGERPVLNLVARRGHRHDVERRHVDAMAGNQRRSRHMCLSHRQRRRARADTQRVFGGRK